MRSIRHAVLLLALSGAMFSLACDGRSSFEGHVRDSSKRPVAGAKIEFRVLGDGKRSEEVSEDDGRFSASFLHSPYGKVNILVTVAKEGYKPYEKQLLAGNYKDFEIVLEEVPEPSAK